MWLRDDDSNESRCFHMGKRNPVKTSTSHITRNFSQQPFTYALVTVSIWRVEHSLNKRIIHNLPAPGGGLPANSSTKSLAANLNVQCVQILPGLRKLFWAGCANCSGRPRKLCEESRRKIHLLIQTTRARRWRAQGA
jgi:hypothetical protein